MPDDLLNPTLRPPGSTAAVPPPPTPLAPQNPALRDVGATPPPTATTPAGTPSQGALWDQILQGRSPFGSSGIDIMNSLAQRNAGETSGPDASQFLGKDGVDGSGYIVRNGQRYVQVGGIPDDQRVLNRDPSQFIYDPKYGLLAPASNIQAPTDALTEAMPFLVAAGLGGPALFSAFGAGGGAAFGAEGAVEGGAGIGADIAGDVGLGGADIFGGGAPGWAAEGGPTIADGPAFADSLTPNINDLITPPPAAGGGGGGPAGGPGGGGFDISTTPDSILNPTLQPPPNVDVAYPDVNISGGSLTDRLINGLTRDPLRTLGAGATLYGATRHGSAPSNISDQRNATTAANKPILDQARGVILNNGQPTDPQKHTIDSTVDRHIQEGVEALKQRAINSGMGADSMVTQQQINQFKEHAETMRNQLYMQQAQQNIGFAIKEWALANEQDFQIQTLAAKLQLEADQQAQELARSISQSLSWLYSMESSGARNAAPPGG